MCIDWADSKGMHIVCDEVYGNSIFPGEQQTSIAECMHNRNPQSERYMGDYVHIVAGFSKDFGISGLRAGYVFSHNKDLISGIESLGLFSAVSNQTQWTLINMLNDEVWTRKYLGEN